MNMRFVVRTHLRQQRLEVLLAVLMPFFLIVESGMANAWVYAGGIFDYADPRTYIALGRGLFFEVLTYSCFKLLKLLCRKGAKQNKLAIAIVSVVGVWCIVVSAGNNLGWVLSGEELAGVLSSVSQYMPDWLALVYQFGLGLLLPVSVGGLALVDVEHLVHEALESAHLDNRALQVHESEMHRTIYLKSQKKQRTQIAEAYDEVADTRAKAMIGKVKQGDMSFGASSQQTTGVRRMPAPASAGSPLLQAPASSPAVSPLGASVGTTVVSPVASSPAPKAGVLSKLFGGS